MRKWIKASLYTLAGLLFLITSALIVGFMDSPSTPRFKDAHGKPLPNAIASFEALDIGGILQWVYIRGRDTSHPILITLHGGPGAVEAEMHRAYNAELEDHFINVHWHQRGAGWTLDRDSDYSDVTGNRIYADLDDLVDKMRARFGQEKVYLLGHSWGSILGLRYAHEHPQKVAAFIGVGQVIDLMESERRGCLFLREEARNRGDETALEELVDACAFVDDPEEPYTIERLMVQRTYISEYGGAFYGDVGLGDLILQTLSTDEGTLSLLVRIIEGSLKSLDRLWPEMRATDLSPLTDFEVPIYFALGRHDYQVNAALAAEHFETIKAPCTHLEWFEKSAHSPPFEQAERFNRFMIETVKAGKCQSANKNQQ